MRVRKYSKEDIPAISRLFYETVHTVNAKDYSQEQLNAWAPSIHPDAYWIKRFEQQTVLIVEEKSKIVGFCSFNRTGYIDCFYVHHNRQGAGIGTLLMKTLIANARKQRIACLRADVSITAMPFFRKMGFIVQRATKKIYRNQSFRQYQMEKRL